MGISGLLPLLKSISRTVHVGIYAGKTVAIDAYSWLHKGAYSCSLDLVQGNLTDSYITYCMNKVNLLLHHNVKPILVFDGGILPSKLETESKRGHSRESYRKKTLELLQAGNRKDAYVMSQKCVEITTFIAHRLIEELRRHNIPFIVAPYEADAQMAYLDKIGMVDAIITEDSDLLLFGCRKILFKLDKYGNAEEICSSELSNASDFDFPQMTHEQFRQICILSGCDYLESLPGIGMKTAIKLMKRHGTAENLLRHLKLTCKQFTAEYASRFYRAELTFKHQRVYDPIQKCLRYLTEPKRTEACNGVLSPNAFVDDWDDYFGPSFDDSIADAVACGLLDPITHEKMQILSLDALPLKRDISTIDLKPIECLLIASDAASSPDFVVPETPKSKRISRSSIRGSPRKLVSRSSPRKDDETIRNSPRKRTPFQLHAQKVLSSSVADISSLCSGPAIEADVNDSPCKSNQEVIVILDSPHKPFQSIAQSVDVSSLQIPIENQPNHTASPKKPSMKKSPYFSRPSSNSKFIGTKRQEKLSQYFSQ